MISRATDQPALARAHSRLVVRRLPLFALCWLGGCVAWTAVLVLEDRLTLAGAGAVVGLQIAVLLAMVAVARGLSTRVVPAVVAGCIALGLIATGVFVRLGGDADFSGYVLLTLYLASSLFFEWGWRPALVLLASTVGVWLLVLPSLPLHVPMAELAGALVTGSILCIGVAEGYWRSFGDAWRHEQERDAVRASERLALAGAERARLAAEAATRTKDLFLAVVSHEIRSPLAAALHWTYILRRAAGNADATARALEGVEGSVLMSVRLIEDLLDVARATQGKLRLEKAEIDLRDVVSTVADGIRFSAEEKDLTLTVGLPDAPVCVHGDAGRLRQIVDNILSNAVKFTPRGGRIAVDLGLTAAGAELVVRDSGIGIPANVLPHVFETFRQGSEEAGYARGGLGLGLAIVRHLVAAHDGTIAAASDGEHRGATFRVRLPAVRDAPAERALPRLAHVRVLVVDEDARAREFVRALLERCGAEVVSVGSVGEALDQLGARRPDVLVADVVLPAAGTSALIDNVRALERAGGPHLPAIAFSAGDRRRALDAGFDLCLPKPADPTDVVLAVASVTGAASSAD